MDVLEAWVSQSVNGWHELIVETRDAPPSTGEFEFEVKRGYEPGGTLLFGETEDGWVRFFSHNPQKEVGFGGHTYTLKMKGCGHERAIKGPWSSRPAVMLEAGFTPCIEVIVKNHCNLVCAMTVEKAREIVERFCPQWQIVLGELRRGSEPQYVVVPQS